MSAPSWIAIVAFAASLGLGAFLWRSGRARTSFAFLVGAPIVAALAFAGSAAIPSAPGSAPPANNPAPVAQPVAPSPETSPRAGGSEIDGWRHSADELRRARRFTEARDMYTRIVKVAPMDADAWADLGDASAAAAGDDLKAGSEAIERALTLDPRHAKALWLKASLELQEHHYEAAAALWQRLLAILPPDSNDFRIVSANLDEARSLAAPAGARR